MKDKESSQRRRFHPLSCTTTFKMETLLASPKLADCTVCTACVYTQHSIPHKWYCMQPVSFGIFASFFLHDFMHVHLTVVNKSHMSWLSSINIQPSCQLMIMQKYTRQVTKSYSGVVKCAVFCSLKLLMRSAHSAWMFEDIHTVRPWWHFVQLLDYLTSTVLK